MMPNFKNLRKLCLVNSKTKSAQEIADYLWEYLDGRFTLPLCLDTYNQLIEAEYSSSVEPIMEAARLAVANDMMSDRMIDFSEILWNILQELGDAI